MSMGSKCRLCGRDRARKWSGYRGWISDVLRKGKEVEVPSPVLMTEDEFELVMGLLEKVTHDNTPFLHLVRTFVTDLFAPSTN